MREAVKRDLDNSADCFERLVWPKIRSACGGGAIKPVETLPGEWPDMFDQLTGIDAWQIVGDGEGLRGIASRVQWPKRGCAGTTTIRLERPTTGVMTEWEKNDNAVKNWPRGFLSAFLRVHAYVDPARDRLLGVCIVENWRMIRHIQGAGAYGPREAGEPGTRDHARFAYLPWAELKRRCGGEYWCRENNNCDHIPLGERGFQPYQTELTLDG